MMEGAGVTALRRPAPSAEEANGWQARWARIDELVDRVIPDTARPYLLPGLMGALLLIGLVLSLFRLNLLLDWSERFDGRGEHLVLRCDHSGGSGGDIWVCDGELVVEGQGADSRSDLVLSRGAMASQQPFVGQRTEVFFDPGRLGTVYPVVYFLNEQTRLYLSLLPRLLLTGGAVLWLAGWALTRDLDETDLAVRDSVRVPGRFVWRARGTRWLATAALVLVVNHFLTAWVIGSLGTF